MSKPDSSSATSLSLIRRAKALDAEAWRRICEVYGPLVYRWARMQGLQDADAADVGQEVFRTVSARIGDFRRDRPGDTFRGWLWTITHHKLGDYVRRQSARSPAEGGTAALIKLNAVPEEQSSNSISRNGFDAESLTLHRALAVIRVEFEDSTWQAFWRSTVDGRQASEIAAELKMTPQAVRQAKYRVLRRLRLEMSED